MQQLLKPTKEKLARNKENNSEDNNIVANVKRKEILKGNEPANKKKKIESVETINVYTNAFEIFSMKNENNTLKQIIKESPKIIKNKKKKDKFAGLNQKAVLASAKLKKLKETDNKLNLFLKPST